MQVEPRSAPVPSLHLIRWQPQGALSASALFLRFMSDDGCDLHAGSAERLPDGRWWTRIMADRCGTTFPEHQRTLGYYPSEMDAALALLTSEDAICAAVALEPPVSARNPIDPSSTSGV